MKFAINYSPQAAVLIESGKIKIDYFKTPPWPDMIAEAEKLSPVAIHFNIRTAGIEAMRAKDWDAVEAFLSSTSTAYVNTHLSVWAKEMPHIPVDDPPTQAHKDEVIERMLADLALMTARFGADRIIAENVPYHSEQNYHLRACIEPGVISGVIDQAGCGFLLDISHALISAHYIGMDPKSYMENLPVKALRELHFTGIHSWDGYLQDHQSILEQDWPWLDWVVEKVKTGAWGQPDLLAFEYGGTGDFFERFSDSAVIVEQVPRLYQICHGLETFANVNISIN
ncbi:MAG: DUF692 family multinuclear iron-containing protein [Chloroflexota bacterium]